MNRNQPSRLHQQKRIRNHVENGDSYEFFNLLTGPEMLEQVESLLPEHRERLFPPTEVLSMYLDMLPDMEQNAGQLDIEAAASAVRCPWLIVHGDADETVDVAEAYRLYSVGNKDVTSIEIVDRGSHTFGAQHPWAGSTHELDRALDATVEWFVAHLL